MRILAPAKLNIFLKILGKRSDGYHLIRSGITFINLFDEIEINQSDKMRIHYTGSFKPEGDVYDDCIIYKTLKYLGLNKNFNFNLTITKNIPVQGGLGSASTNAAALIQGLEKMNLINKQKPKVYAMLGADIPCFLFKKNCLVTGIGDIIQRREFQKYYFLLVKPNFNFSTKFMYSQIDKLNLFNVVDENIVDAEDFNKNDIGNDFEEILNNKFQEVREILHLLSSLNKVIFSRMTGSGSCCYAAFKEKKFALKAQEKITCNFNNLWTFVGENNFF